MDTESLYVMSGLCGMLIIGIVGGGYFLGNYIRTRKHKLEKEKEKKIIDEVDRKRIERKVAARMSLYEFKKNVHLINPVEFNNGVTVCFREKYTYISDSTNYIKFGIEYEVKGTTYYDPICCNGTSSYVYYVDDKYSLEDLEGYDWIIETAYNLTEDRLNKIKKERDEKESFIENINNNKLVSKNN